jgi:hypothetical protein
MFLMMSTVDDGVCVALTRAEGSESHYLDRPHLGFMQNVTSAVHPCSSTCHSPPANKEKINLY